MEQTRQKVLDDFPYQDIWEIIGMIIITFSIYFPFWLNKHSNIVNALTTKNQISNLWFPVSLGITLVNLVMFIIDEMSNENGYIILIGNIIGWLDAIIIISWGLVIMSEMNSLLNAKPGERFRYSACLTFFFSIFYLQYKLNKIKSVVGLDQ